MVRILIQRSCYKCRADLLSLLVGVRSHTLFGVSCRDNFVIIEASSRVVSGLSSENTEKEKAKNTPKQHNQKHVPKQHHKKTPKTKTLENNFGLQHEVILREAILSCITPDRSRLELLDAYVPWIKATFVREPWPAMASLGL